MDSKAEKDAATVETPEPRPRFTEAQRSNLTRLIQGSRFSAVANEVSGQKVTGKPSG
jgi:hypothetical protein